MSLLLHVCCGPCATIVTSCCQEAGFSLTGYYYNPNIYPRSEHELRLRGAKTTFEQQGIELLVDSASENSSAWQSAISKDREDRCFICYRLRLERVAEEAFTLGFAAFSTTLLISPFQQHDLVKQAGEEAGALYGVDFHYQDLRPSFKATYLASRKLSLYRQNYCGCHYSLDERLIRRKRQDILK